MSSISELLSMKVGDTFIVKGDAFHILSRTVFSENTYNWTEYQGRNNFGDIMWLSVDERSQKVDISERIPLEFTRNTDVYYDGKDYQLKERGRARVVQVNGNTDVELNEEMEYWDYEEIHGDTQIEFEIWEDGAEASLSVSLNTEDVVAKRRGYGNYNRDNSSSFSSNQPPKTGGGKKVLGVILALIAVIIGFNMITGGSGKNKNVKEYLKNSTKYSYTTSITSDSVKVSQADVYETDLSVDKAAKDIIYSCEPKENSDLSGEDSVSILYKDYYVFVYEGEDNKTLVQVSSREYAYRSSNTLYRSRYRHQNSFFRDYYFYRALTYDRRRYGTSSFYRSYNPVYRGSNINNYSKKYYSDSSFYNSGSTTKGSTGSTSTGGSGVKKYSTSGSSSSSGSSKGLTTTSSKSSSSWGSSSVRRSSSSTRRSFGGGTSFGK